MQCQNCGTTVQEDSKFCYHCGAPLENQSLEVSSKKTLPPPPSPPKSEVSAFSIIFAIALGIASLIFFHNAYNDIGKGLREEATLGLHATLTLPLVIIAFVLLLDLRKRKPEFRVAIIPYFITAMTLLARFIIESGVYFYEKYQKPAIYVTVFITMMILTAIILYAQKKHKED